SEGGPGTMIPALATRRSACGLVVTRGTPPREEGCRPANRGFTLALMTCVPGCARGTRRVSRWSRRLGWRDAVRTRVDAYDGLAVRHGARAAGSRSTRRAFRASDTWRTIPSNHPERPSDVARRRRSNPPVRREAAGRRVLLPRSMEEDS